MARPERPRLTRTGVRRGSPGPEDRAPESRRGEPGRLARLAHLACAPKASAPADNPFWSPGCFARAARGRGESLLGEDPPRPPAAAHNPARGGRGALSANGEQKGERADVGLRRCNRRDPGQDAVFTLGDGGARARAL